MRHSILLLGFLFAMTSLQAQRDLKKANEAFKLLEYYKAIHYYEQCLNNSFIPEAAENLAHSYRITRQTEKAETWYRRVTETNYEDPEIALFLAQMLQSNGKSQEALKWAQKYSALKPNDPRGKNIIEGVRNLDLYMSGNEMYSSAPSDCNLPGHDDFSPFYSNGNVYFTSDRADQSSDGSWSGHSFTRLFNIPATGGTVQTAGKNLVSRFHDGAAWVSPDEKKMIFTRNNVSGKTSRKSSDNTVHLILVYAENTGTEWKAGKEFEHNSQEYSTAYPALNSDANYMVFASDRPGGYGEMDLYFTKRQSNGNWSNPVNLGPQINTPGDEIFPFLLEDGSLVFSSDGLPGMGGQDFYHAQRSGESWAMPRNLGAPFNSPKDETGFWCQGDLESGWFSSNRDSKEALYDVYSFEKRKEPNVINGLVVDKYTQIPLKEVFVQAIDPNSGALYETVSGEDGQFQLEIPSGAAVELEIQGEKNNVPTTSAFVAFLADDHDKSHFVQLEHNDPRFTLEGFSLSSKDKKPIEGTLVKLLNTGTGMADTAYSGPDGKFSFQLEQKSDYIITGFKDRYFSTIANASTQNLDRSQTLYVNLFLYTQVVIINEDIDLSEPNPMQMNPIHFDLDKHNIRPDAAKELDKLVATLNQNSNLKKVQLSAHTDSQGDWTYNQRLSERRAKSAVEYLVRKGISGSRLEWKGFGESRIKNHCKNGVTCPDEKHEVNRRIEFRVLEMAN